VNITRHEIVSALHGGLLADPQVLAMWLEGADATGTVDEYSDIDVCCSVEAGALTAVTARARDILAGIGALDLVEALHAEEDGQHTVFHLAGTPAYLLIDFDIYVGRGSTFAMGDEIEKPLILFDKAAVIRFLDRDEYLNPLSSRERLQKLKSTIAQGSRIDKYLKRGLFLEAYGYYHRWLLEPLVEILRMRYTPLHPDYYIVHISRHLPGDVLRRLEELFKINSIAEIGVKSGEAVLFFNEVSAELSRTADNRTDQ
jgi:hypothetical protein